MDSPTTAIWQPPDPLHQSSAAQAILPPEEVHAAIEKKLAMLRMERDRPPRRRVEAEGRSSTRYTCFSGYLLHMSAHMPAHMLANMFARSTEEKSEEECRKGDLIRAVRVLQRTVRYRQRTKKREVELLQARNGQTIDKVRHSLHTVSSKSLTSVLRDLEDMTRSPYMLKRIILGIDEFRWTNGFADMWIDTCA